MADSPLNPATDAPADFVGGFRLLRLIGQGGMSEVYLGYDETTLAPIAVKLLADHLADSKQFVNRFYREARMSRLLSHPNLVHGTDAGYDSDSRKHYLAMEYIDGPSAHELLTTTGPLPPGIVVSIGIDVSKALAFMHSRNYVHRDVKPDNILLHPDGIAKLSDLGLAKRIASGDENLTHSDQSVGTPQYMPQEQAANAALVDGRSDLFALGATLYHLLTGQVPFRGVTHEEIAREKAQDVYRPVRDFAATIPPALDRILQRALALDIRLRYQSAAEFAADLEATEIGSPMTPGDLPRPIAGAGKGGPRQADYPTQANLSVNVDTAETPAISTESLSPINRVLLFGTKIGLAVASLGLSGAMFFRTTKNDLASLAPTAEPVESDEWMPRKPILPD